MSRLARHTALAITILSACTLVFVVACGDNDADGPTDAASQTPTTAGWLEYTDPAGQFSLRYPSDWYLGESGVAFYSHDPSGSAAPEDLPSDSIKVEPNFFDTTGRSTCGGVLDLNSSGEVQSIDSEASETTLSGLPAWELVNDAPDPPATRIHGISLVQEGYCVNLVAYYTQETPDEAIFEQIAESFEIHS